MRTFNVFFLAVLFSSALFAQFRSHPTLNNGGFGNVVFPGGTSAQPGVSRNFGNVVFPGTGGPKLNVPFSITDPTFGARLGRTVAGQNVYGQQFSGRGRNRATVVPYAFPVYVGSGYDAQPQQQPNVVVIYPQQQPQQQVPVYVNRTAPPDQSQYQPVAPPASESGGISIYQAPSGPRPETAASAEPARFLIAFNDRTIYSAVAYWIDGETLHYFTNGNTHNQISLALVDRELTERLNKEMGSDLKLPK
jgi:hypothetical protein